MLRKKLEKIAQEISFRKAKKLVKQKQATFSSFRFDKEYILFYKPKGMEVKQGYIKDENKKAYVRA